MKSTFALSVSVILAFLVHGWALASTPTETGEQWYYRHVGWDYESSSACDLLLLDEQGRTLAEVKYYPRTQGKLFFTFPGQDVRSVNDVQLGYLLNGHTLGLEQALAKYEDTGTDPLGAIYQSSKEFLEFFKYSSGECVNEGFGPVRKIKASSEPKAAGVIERVKTLVPVGWQAATWHNYNHPKEILRYELEYREGIAEQVHTGQGLLTWPKVEYTQTLKRAHVLVLGFDQIKNYVKAPRTYIYEYPVEERPKIRRRTVNGKTQEYVQFKFRGWVKISSERVYQDPDFVKPEDLGIVRGSQKSDRSPGSSRSLPTNNLHRSGSTTFYRGLDGVTREAVRDPTGP